MSDPTKTSVVGAFAVGEHEILVRYRPAITLDPGETIRDFAKRYGEYQELPQQPHTLSDLGGLGLVRLGVSTPFIDSVNTLQSEMQEIGRKGLDGAPGIRTTLGRTALLNMIGMSSMLFVDSRKIIADIESDEALDELVEQVVEADRVRDLKHFFLHAEQRITTFTESEMLLTSDTPTIAKEIDAKLYDAKVRGLSTPYGAEKLVQAISDLHFLYSVVKKA